MLSNPNEEEKLDPRVRRTRNLILQAFMDLLAEKGFQSISVQDVTEKAGINRATFYAHFPDKYALLDYSIETEFRQELEKRTLDACHYTDENLNALIIAVCEFVAKIHSQCASVQPQFESLIEAQVKKQVQALLQMWLEKVGSTMDPKTSATAASWAIYGLAAQWSHDQSKRKPAVEEFAGQVFPLIALNLTLKQLA